MTVTDASLRRAGLMRYAQDSDGKEIPDACFVRPLNQGANPDNVPIAQFSKACLQAILGVDGSHVLDAADLVKIIDWIHANWGKIKCPETVPEGASCNNDDPFTSVVATYYTRLWDLGGLAGKTIDGLSDDFSYIPPADLFSVVDDLLRFVADPMNLVRGAVLLVGAGMVVFGASRLL